MFICGLLLSCVYPLLDLNLLLCFVPSLVIFGDCVLVCCFEFLLLYQLNQEAVDFAGRILKSCVFARKSLYFTLEPLFMGALASPAIADFPLRVLYLLPLLANPSRSLETEVVPENSTALVVCSQARVGGASR